MRQALIRPLFLIVLAALALPAQTITGSITGTVTDPSGALVANVKVRATNTATGVEFPAATNAAGVYNILFLAPGDYQVTAEAAGFRKVVLAAFTLEVNQIARVDITLEVGDLTQSVDITATAPILQTESTATGDTVTSTKVTSLPLNGRNFASLLTLLPGVIVTNPALVSSSYRYGTSSSRPQVNGNREGANNFMLDGVDVTDSRINRIGYHPSVDALEEVKVVTGNGGAEFGNVGGAAVIMTLKSGTNRFHGSVFEFLRNDKLDANGFFLNRTGVPRRPFRDNIFGGTLGGPLRRNRLFFFVDYEGAEQRSSGSASANVAPKPWRDGDLSQLLVRLNQVVRDPLTGPTALQRTPFPGNLIPQSRITNPVARKLFSDPSLYPEPNNAGTGAVGIGGNYLGDFAGQISNRQGDAKLDWRASARDSFTGHWSISRYDQFNPRASMPVVMPSGMFVPTTSAVAGWTRAYSSRWVGETRVAYTRIHFDEGVAVDWSGKLGPDGNARFGIAGGQPVPGLSQILLGDNLSSIGNAAGNVFTVENKYQAQSSFTLQTGAHLVKFGGQLARLQQNARFAGILGLLGTFRFDGAYSGSGFGDFLLNALSKKTRGDIRGTWGQRHWRAAAFAQDDWKLRRNLTLNLGLRWEYLSPFVEVADRLLNIDIFTGDLLYPGKTRYGRALYRPYYKEIMPVIGVAWTPDALHGNLVVRAGYRFLAFLEGVPMTLRLSQNPPFMLASERTYSAAEPGDITAGFADAFARGDISGPRTGPTPFYSATAFELNLRPQFSNQWNFALESRLAPSTSVSLAYVGQRGTHLLFARDGNQALPGSGPFSTWALLEDRRPLARALPNVSGITYVESGSIMSYHSLQAVSRRRLSRGMEFLASYTLSRSLTDATGVGGCGYVVGQGIYMQNSYNRRGEFGPMCADALHNFSAGALYELPFGKGKRRGASWPRALNLALGGWNLSHTLGAHSGFPVTVFAAASQPLTGQATAGVRPNRYRPLVVDTRTVDRWFGTNYTICDTYGVDDGKCAYGRPALGSFGNSAVSTERAPSFFNLDISLGKKFFVAEKRYIEFRSEFFNLLNHVSFGPPGRDITIPASFGQIGGQIGSPRNIQFALKYCF